MSFYYENLAFTVMLIFIKIKIINTFIIGITFSVNEFMHIKPIVVQDHINVYLINIVILAVNYELQFCIKNI